MADWSLESSNSEKYSVGVFSGKGQVKQVREDQTCYTDLLKPQVIHAESHLSAIHQELAKCCFAVWLLSPELASMQQAALYRYSELSYQTTKSQKTEEKREGAGCTASAAAWTILGLAGVRSAGLSHAACSHSFPLTNGTVSESRFNTNFQLLATLWWHLVDQSKISLPAGKPCKASRMNLQSGSLFPKSKELCSIRQGLAFLYFFLPFLLCE